MWLVWVLALAAHLSWTHSPITPWGTHPSKMRRSLTHRPLSQVSGSKCLMSSVLEKTVPSFKIPWRYQPRAQRYIYILSVLTVLSTGRYYVFSTILESPNYFWLLKSKTWAYFGPYSPTNVCFFCPSLSSSSLKLVTHSLNYYFFLPQLHWCLRHSHLALTPVGASRPEPADLACSLHSTSGTFR